MPSALRVSFDAQQRRVNPSTNSSSPSAPPAFIPPPISQAVVINAAANEDSGSNSISHTGIVAICFGGVLAAAIFLRIIQLFVRWRRRRRLHPTKAGEDDASGSSLARSMSIPIDALGAVEAGDVLPQARPRPRREGGSERDGSDGGEHISRAAEGEKWNPDAAAAARRMDEFGAAASARSVMELHGQMLEAKLADSRMKAEARADSSGSEPKLPETGSPQGGTERDSQTQTSTPGPPQSGGDRLDGMMDSRSNSNAKAEIGPESNSALTGNAQDGAERERQTPTPTPRGVEVLENIVSPHTDAKTSAEPEDGLESESAVTGDAQGGAERESQTPTPTRRGGAGTGADGGIRVPASRRSSGAATVASSHADNRTGAFEPHLPVETPKAHSPAAAEIADASPLA